MGLVIQDGKLLIKPMLDGDGNPVLDGNGNPKNALATATRPSEACDCCGGTPSTGCCCRLKQDGSTDTVITTTSEECSAYISPQTDVVAVKFNPGKNCDDPDVECPEKWVCVSTDKCVQKPDGTYATETECVDNAPVDCGEPPSGPGAGCYLPCEEVLSTTGSTPEEAVQEVRDLFEGSEGITGTPEDYGLEVRFIDCLDIGGGVQICSAGVFCCGGLADMDSPQCGSKGYTPSACGNFASQDEFTKSPDRFPLEWYPGKTCDDPSIDCGCYEDDKYTATRAEAEQSFNDNYGAYNWSLLGGYVYDQDTDQWSYRAICCDELSYDDQGKEWCGPHNRSNPLP